VDADFVRHVGPTTTVPLLDPLLLPLELLLEMPLLLELTPLLELLLLLETGEPELLLLLETGEPELLLDELLLVSAFPLFCGSPGSAAQAIPTQVAAVRATKRGAAFLCMDVLGVLRSARSLAHLDVFITT
jgi:hypothetical protein